MDEHSEFTYASKQATRCARCGERKHTPLRNDRMGGYVCLTCIDKELIRLQSTASVKPTDRHIIGQCETAGFPVSAPEALDKRPLREGQIRWRKDETRGTYSLEQYRSGQGWNEVPVCTTGN